MTLPAVTVLLAAGCGASHGHDGAAQAGQPVADPRLHPAFALTADQLLQMVGELPDPAPRRIAERPRRFLALTDAVLDLPRDFTILVDKQHPLPADYEPDDLVSLRDFRGRIGYAAADRTVRQAIVDDLLAMAAAAREDGVELLVQSAYRSWSYQQTLYQNYVARHGEEAAARFSARPGHSQHQLGTAVDFAPIGHQFTGTADDRWLRENAWRFGFSLSYPDGYEEVTGYIFEPWHYRYVGRPATLLEREFFGGIQQYMLEFLHRYGDRLRAARLE
ncbi:MAG: D-alanyl-D-alanine carboxypeptidase family protein [Spirochaetaceae bacterium]|nr:MAG: D-alanyl-D-alanine carboxypeptidase family protein [Spirochaetaceae bacterium]